MSPQIGSGAWRVAFQPDLFNKVYDTKARGWKFFSAMILLIKNILLLSAGIGDFLNLLPPSLSSFSSTHSLLIFSPSKKSWWHNVRTSLYLILFCLWYCKSLSKCFKDWFKKEAVSWKHLCLFSFSSLLVWLCSSWCFFSVCVLTPWRSIYPISCKELF